MSLHFAAVMPHSPLLIPNIGKENTSQFVSTLPAIQQLTERIAQAKLDTLLVISAKGATVDNNFTINVHQEFKANFEIFGDLVTDLRIPGDLELAGRFREHLEAEYPVRLATDTGLDYAASVPLFLISDKIKLPIVPLIVPHNSHDLIQAFAPALQETILNSKKRIGIIAAADLSHRLSKQSPAGYSAKAKKIDQRLVEILKENDAKGLIEIESSAVEAACEDIPVLDLFLGLLDDVGATPGIVNYEPLFGVGHLTLCYDLGSRSSTQP